MMKVLALLAVVAGTGWGIWAFYLSPDAVRKKAVEKVIAEMNDAAQSGDKAKALAFTDKFFLPEAKLTLEVRTFGSGPFEAKPIMKQEFAKESFHQFLDHLLYSVETFQGKAELFSYNEGETEEFARIEVRVPVDAEGNAYARRDRIFTHFSTDTTCGMKLRFVQEQGYLSPKLVAANCNTMLNLSPKGDYSSSERLKDKLRDGL